MWVATERTVNDAWGAGFLIGVLSLLTGCLFLSHELFLSPPIFDTPISLMGDTQQQEQGEHAYSHECKNCSSSTGALPILLSDPAYWTHRDSWYWYLLTLLIPPDFGRLHKTCRKGNKKIMDVCPISETASFHVHSRAEKHSTEVKIHQD